MMDVEIGDYAKKFQIFFCPCADPFSAPQHRLRSHLRGRFFAPMNLDFLAMTSRSAIILGALIAEPLSMSHVVSNDGRRR